MAHVGAYEEDCASKVLIIVTGGTFIMAPTANGLEVQPGYLSKRMQEDPDFHHLSLPSYDIYEWKNPIDSSCINKNDWITLANQIEEAYNKYDGFIILHGTDTMSYTASALSFMLENLSKPVVITGAQIPIGEVFNDAKNNLIASLCVAGKCQICEVCLMFNNKLFRGNRSAKCDAWHQDAFASPNYPTLGLFGVELEMEEDLFAIAPTKSFNVHKKIFNNIVVVWVTPGFNCNLLKSLLTSKEEIAIVLSFYGSSDDVNTERLYALLHEAKNKYNKVVVLMSQCGQGHFNMYSDLKRRKQRKLKQVTNILSNINQKIQLLDKDKDDEKYDGSMRGTKLHEIGAMNAHDMTVEAVVTKLCYLMGKGLRGNKLRKLFETDLRGEMTSMEEIAAKIMPLQNTS